MLAAAAVGAAAAASATSAPGSVHCPTALLPLAADPIGPAVTECVVFVGHTSAGYRIWNRVH